MSIIERQCLIGQNLRGFRFPSGETLTKCDFRKADLRGADFSEAFFVDVDFRGANIRAAKFKLDCAQGSHVKIDDFTTTAFLFWLMSVCELSPEMYNRIDAIVSPYKAKLEEYFSREA